MTNQETFALIEECRAALAEELSAWDIDPPLHHVKQAHDKCVAWLAATQPAPQPEAQALPPEWTPEMSRAVQLYSELGAYAASNLSGAYGLFEEFWSVAHRAAVSSPAPAPLTPDEAAYPRDVFQALIDNNSPYAFYLFQWVPYQTDALRWRLKMMHDVRTFDGREALGIWPNGSSCGPFKDHEVEFIRISRKQWGSEWVDPRPGRINGIGLDGGM